MLKLLSLPITLSVAFICSVFYFPSPSSAQDFPICYIITSSGQMMNLESICKHGQQMQALTNACNGPFDTEGFPVVFAQEVQRLKTAIANAKQRNVDVARDAQVQSAVAALRNQMPFAWQLEQFRKQQQALRKQARITRNSVEDRVRLREQLQVNSSQFSQLTTNQCFQRFMQALRIQLRS